LQEIYGVEVVGFSWPSEGFLSSGDDQPNMPAAADADGAARGEQSLAGIHAGNRKEAWADATIRRYRQAKMNAQDSGDALARFLRLLATARLYVNRQPMTIAGHSLGCHFMQYAIETEGAAESLGAAHNIVLLAACCRADGHASWVEKLNPKGQLFITYNKGDNVLFGAFIADGSQTKLGTEPGARVISPKVRYVSFTNAQVGLGGHGYFVRDRGDDVPKAPKKVFQRMFSSERDIKDDQGEYPRMVYPVGCDADGSTCYMAAPDAGPVGGP
jgi:esterase/lipase superfamily enzyme